MTDEIIEAIKKSLPSQVGDTLRERLIDADRFEEDNEILQKNLEVCQMKLIRFETDELKFNELEDKEKDIKEREFKLDLTIMTMESKCSQRLADSFHDFTMGLVRNTEFRQNVTGMTPVIDNSGYASPQAYSYDSNTKKA